MSSSKLMFKGDKKEKKKHRKRRRDQHEPDEHPEPTEGWLNPPSQAHIQGPLYIICIRPATGRAEESRPSALAIQPSPLSPIAPLVPAPLDPAALQSLEPADVNHVLVATRIIDSTHKLTLRTANARYLAADQLGAVSAEQEARGPQEEWAFEPVPASPNDDHPDPDGMFTLKSCLYNKLLSVEELASGKLVLRADSDSPAEPAAHLLVRMQAAELLKARKRLADEQAQKGLLSAAKTADAGLTILKPGQSFHDLEANNIRQYQARGAGRLQLPAEGNAGLKKARKEGRLAEELLDRRAKLKSDRYAK
ncbi:hypothetical protein PtA15_17A25 [Puccinia triticina]|uniref:Uncharacterized protein n=1 Tax=Puccinia triticina TaxID=208348 RepID=A0ABY7D6Y7_9BASI|nr:uncharacterized protein PtA15_17A25 [Puccinia triticina]WAQ92544.1 hypothetical protein PtA15_17A25 [Puccinia triticina]